MVAVRIIGVRGGLEFRVRLGLGRWVSYVDRGLSLIHI